jgi:5-hydroxyisourate hydrolase
MGKLTTHVLDTANGCPASGLAVSLYRGDSSADLLTRLHTNADGRLDAPLLQDAALTVGVYELVFEAGDYFRARGTLMPEPPFVDRVTIRFGIAAPEQSYHVPLLVSPWSYSTYRGS